MKQLEMPEQREQIEKHYINGETIQYLYIPNTALSKWVDELSTSQKLGLQHIYVTNLPLSPDISGSLIVIFWFITMKNSYLGWQVFKVCVHYFLTNFYFSPNDSPSKTKKNVFYFI